MDMMIKEHLHNIELVTGGRWVGELKNSPEMLLSVPVESRNVTTSIEFAQLTSYSHYRKYCQEDSYITMWHSSYDNCLIPNRILFLQNYDYATCCEARYIQIFARLTLVRRMLNIYYISYFSQLRNISTRSLKNVLPR